MKETHHRSSFIVKPIVLSIHLALSSGLILSSPSALAKSNQNIRYNIPAGKLNQVLNQFAAVSGVAISMNATELSKIQSQGLNGTYTIEQGFITLLANTSLKAHKTADGYILKDRVVSKDPAPPTLRSTSQQNEVSLPIITVTADQTNPYLANSPSSVATKSELTPRETPFTINQVSQELIQERGDQSIFETLESFAGITSASNPGNIGQGMNRNLSVRGFEMGQTLLNGQRMYSTTGDAQNTDNLERIEVLRGPAGLYYGSAEPGGVINLSYKKPKAEAAYQFITRTDSKGSYGGMFDATGSLTSDQKLRYRAVVSYNHRIDDQEHTWSEPQSGMVALSYLPTDNFETSLTYERLETNSIPERENNSIDYRTGKFYDIPRDFFWGSLDDLATQTTDNILWDMKWQLSDALKVSANWNIQQTTQFWQITRSVTGKGGASDLEGNVDRFVNARDAKGNSYSGNIDISGKFNLWNIENQWLVGAGLGSTDNSASSGRAVSSGSRIGQKAHVGKINIYDPIYHDWNHRELIYADARAPRGQQEDKNVYLQNVLTFPNQKTRLMIGAGWTEYKSTPGVVSTTDPVRTEKKWTPRIAIMHDVLPTATVYASYGENFTPNDLGKYDMAGKQITDAVLSSQFEIGYKQELFNQQALVNLALFRLDKENILSMVQKDGVSCNADLETIPDTAGGYDPVNSDCRYALNGLERSQGVEISASGQINDWWSTDFSYAYIDAKYKEADNPINVGRTKPNIPEHNFTLWNNFKLYDTDNFGRVNAGIGVKAWSKAHDAWVQDNSTEEIRSNINPGYTLVDLSLSWTKQLTDKQKVNLGFTVKNALDKTYYDRSRFANSGTIIWGDERRYLLTAKYDF
ncbi:TonB-dependent siderophore receptor [Acinetobacter ursingii]|uniref:TonB-dependent siderophore receptor n=1 Tax=Acinetobacter ursingii TaxID=108980 RepID=UPI0021CDC369|nr:TonB-dependent receptor [Acinetobacter ursingii]MCU4483761.1 TonB-dependent receptor [Acinetobacter ursingii]MCU4508089.1 TonB-dependent receptor [Acinetobacter ursingii]MCU4571097.1 TonB-dependent receptor [Acinetobacter ursingii]